MKTWQIAAAAASFAFAGSAFAGHPVLTFDIQQFDYSASGALSESFTGTITYSFGGDTVLNGVGGASTTDGPFTDAGDGGTLSSFSGMLTFSGGMVTGGSFSFGNTAGDSVTVSVTGGFGDIDEDVSTEGSSFSINGLLFDWVFVSDDSPEKFGDVDVSAFFDSNGDAIASLGDFRNFDLSGGITGRADGEFLVVSPIPLPSAAGLGLVGLAGVASRRRR